MVVRTDVFYVEVGHRIASGIAWSMKNKPTDRSTRVWHSNGRRCDMVLHKICHLPLLLQNHAAPHGPIQVSVLKIALGIIQKKYPELQYRQALGKILHTAGNRVSSLTSTRMRIPTGTIYILATWFQMLPEIIFKWVIRKDKNEVYVRANIYKKYKKTTTLLTTTTPTRY